MCDYFLFQLWYFLAVSQAPWSSPWEYLTVVVLPIYMIHSFPGAHNISVWDAVEPFLVIIRIEALLNSNRKLGDEMQRKLLASATELYVSFYCLLLEALGTVAIKYLWYFGKHHPKVEAKNIFSVSKSFPFNLQVFIKGKK